MADLIEDPKKKKASFGDAAAAAADPGVMQIGGATRPAPMAVPAAPDIGPFVGKPGDFPVNPDGTPMMKPAAGAIPPALPSVARPPDPIGRTVQINSDGSPALTPDQKQAMANQTAAYVTGAQASAAARPPDAGGINLGAVQPAPTERPPAHSTATLAAPKSDYARQMGELGGFLGAIPGKVAKWFVSAPGSDGMLSFDKQPAATPDMSAYVTRMKPDQYSARSATMPVKSDSPLPVMSVAPEPDALPSSAIAPISAGAVKTQGQMNMEADLRSAEAMKAERLAAEGRAPQAVVTHSGNDWQARNNLRNLEVSASSLTANPQDVQAYIDARKHDTSLQGGGTAADIANVAAANRNNEINSTAQVANARTAQQGQQFGASHELAKQRLALDSRTQGAQAAEYGAQARLKTVQANTAEQLAALQNRYMSAKPEEQAAIAKQIQTLSGKYDKAQLHTVNQPDTMAPDGITKLGGGQRLVVQGADGSFHEVPVGTNQQPASGVASPKSKAEYDALPKGAQYMKDGVLKTKA